MTQRDDKGRFVPGVSGNPNGRPRSGFALIEAVREKLDPSKALELLAHYLDDATVPLEKRVAAMLPWLHAGYLKPPTTTNIDATVTQGAMDLSHLSDDELAELLAKLEGPALVAKLERREPDRKSSEPAPPDDDSTQDTEARTP